MIALPSQSDRGIIRRTVMIFRALILSELQSLSLWWQIKEVMLYKQSSWKTRNIYHVSPLLEWQYSLFSIQSLLPLFSLPWFLNVSTYACFCDSRWCEVLDCFQSCVVQYWTFITQTLCLELVCSFFLCQQDIFSPSRKCIVCTKCFAF